MNEGLVYGIKNKLTDKVVYIGITNNFKKRVSAHKSRAKKGYRNLKLYNGMKKHGIENFDFFIIEDNIEYNQILYDKEVYYIKKYNTFKEGYNMTIGGEIGTGDRIILENITTKEYLIKNNHKSAAVLGSELKVSHETIYRLYRYYGIKKETYYYNKIINKPTKEYLIKTNSTKTLEEIAKEFNISKTYLRKLYKEYGINKIRVKIN